MRRFVALTALLPLLLASPAAALEIDFRQQTYGADLAVDPRNTFNKDTAETQIFAANPEKGLLAFSTPMQVFTLVDNTGLLAAALFGTSNLVESRAKAMEGARQRGTRQGDKVEYTVSAGPYLPGLSAYLSIGMGKGQGAQVGYPNVSNGAKASQATDNEVFFVDIGFPMPLYQQDTLTLGLLTEVYYRQLKVKGLRYGGPGSFGTKFKAGELNEAQIMVPFNLLAAWRPIPFFRLRPSVGYDPVMGLLGVLPGLDNRPQQGFTWGLEMDLLPISFLRVSAGFKGLTGNVSTDRPLSSQATYLGAAWIF